MSQDDHCESDGSGTCLIHFGRLIDSDPEALLSEATPDICDLSPEFMDTEEVADILILAARDFDRD